MLGEELLACCSFDTEDVDTDIDRLFASAFDTAEFESIPCPAPIDVIKYKEVQTLYSKVWIE